jgi:ribose transport system permease protein
MSSVQAEAKKAKRPFKLPPETGIAVVVLILLCVGSLMTPDFLTVSNMEVLLLNGFLIKRITASRYLMRVSRGT